VQNVYMKVPRDKRRLTIHDQLAPSYFRTYTRAELVALLECCGFTQVEVRDCRGYSWTAIGTAPARDC
jgi:hypothetical protein